MSFSLYNDRVVFPIWDAQRQQIEEDFELYDERDFGGMSHTTQLKQLVSHWCPNCECAFRKIDIPSTISPNRPKCPACGTALDEFDLDEVAPDWTDDSWMFPDGHDDGESIDSMPWDQ